MPYLMQKSGPKIHTYQHSFSDVDNLSTSAVQFQSLYLCLLATYELASVLSFFVSNFSDIRTPKTAGLLTVVVVRHP